MFTSLVFCWLGNGWRLGQFWHFRTRGRGRYRRSLTDFNGAVLVIQHHVSTAAVHVSAGGRAIVSAIDFEFAEIGLDFSIARLGIHLKAEFRRPHSRFPNARRSTRRSA